MADYTKTAVAEVRDYLWTNIQQDNILNKNDYIADGFIVPLIPIIPTQQVPEFNNLISGKPYIVYDFEINQYNEDYWICEENIIFSIVSPDYGKIVQIMNYLVDLFRRMDDTAKNVNAGLANDSKFQFYYFYINNAVSPEAAEEEGGNQIGYIDVTYKYSRQIGSDGRFL